jgi:hypothetical protein
MVVGEIELAPHVQVALVTGFLNRPRRFEREPPAQPLRLRSPGGKTVRRFGFATGIRVQTTGAVTGLATGVEPVFALGDEPRVIGGPEATVNFLMALFAFRGADVFRARHIREHHCPVADGAAGNRRQHQNGRAGGERQISTMPALRRPVWDGWQFCYADFGLSFISRMFGKHAVLLEQFLFDQDLSRV